MPGTIKLSENGLKKVEEMRQRKRWAKTEPAWYDFAEVSPSTLKRFLNRERIRPQFFVKLCEVIGITNWEEVAEIYSGQIEDEDSASEKAWRLVLSAKFNETTRAQVLLILEHLTDLLEDPRLTLKEVKEGSLVLVLSGSEDGFEWMYYLFKSGQVTELLGFPILEVRLATVNLSEWLQNNFVDAIQKGWRSTAEIFTTKEPQLAFRSDLVQRAKEIQIGDITLALILDLREIGEQEISIIIGVYPLGEGTYLPDNLKLILNFESGEPVELSVNDDREGFHQEVSFAREEEFRLEIVVGENSITEYFVL